VLKLFHPNVQFRRYLFRTDKSLFVLLFYPGLSCASEREGPDFSWNDISVRTRLEGLCEEACRIRYWAAMRSGFVRAHKHKEDMAI